MLQDTIIRNYFYNGVLTLFNSNNNHISVIDTSRYFMNLLLLCSTVKEEERRLD